MADEEGQNVVEIGLVFVPQLLRVPVLGRILRLIAPNGGNDLQAFEEAQRAIQAKGVERATRIRKQARYVLKASDAMQCVEDNLMNAGFLLALTKGIVNVILFGNAAQDAPNVLADRIFTCIESKVLKQTGRRRRKEKTYYGRPARGHGHGRS